MHYKKLGSTGLFVSDICLGTMTFGGEGSFFGHVGKLQQKDATEIVAAALEAGVNFIDTADMYSYGVAETLLGTALKEIGVRRSDVVIATKVYSKMSDVPNDMGASRGHILDSIERSLDRLQTDHIDIYQIHAQDLQTPAEETMRALDHLVSRGLVRYLGCSNWQAWKIMQARGLADKRGWAPLDTLQAHYSLASRGLEREIAPMLEETQIGLLVWSPLSGGILSGRFGPGAENPADARRSNFDFPPVDKEQVWKIVAVQREIGKARGVSPARVALAWVLSKPFVTSVIVGVKTKAQLEDNLAASGLALTPEEIARLDAVSALPDEYPGWMIPRQNTGRIPEEK
jgi:aryl-alcohol dehydrogenase-like predicted oxidoreductase